MVRAPLVQKSPSLLLPAWGIFATTQPSSSCNRVRIDLYLRLHLHRDQLDFHHPGTSQIRDGSPSRRTTPRRLSARSKRDNCPDSPWAVSNSALPRAAPWAKSATMVPQRPPEHVIDRTPEYEDFINKLRDFHTERGTRFDPEPKITPYQLDLLKIFNHVVQSGGYDRITDEKLAWRRVCAELGIRATNEAAAAFSLKTAYYKNLAAYEIRTVHNQTPPPPEILEETSAKGGSLLTRTLSNFKPKDRRDTSTQNSPAPSGDDGTPARESRPEEPPSTGRAARGLRQAPPQRVIFQPETGPTRPSRHSSGQHHAGSSTPQGGQGSHGHGHANSQGNGHGQIQGSSRMPSHQMAHAPLGQIPQPHIVRGGASASFTPQSYEYQSPTVERFRPPANVPLPLRPVETPSNAPAKFVRARRQMDPVPPAPNRQAPLPGSKLHPNQDPA